MFLDILTSRNSPEVVLRLMNEAGVLGRFVPDFGRIVAMMQFNMYHHYTVDEHLLRVDRRADRHRGGTARQRPSARAQDRRRPSATAARCYVATFPARHRQGTAGRSFAGRCRDRAESSGRASGWTKPRPKRWPGWWSIICSCPTRRRAAISPTPPPSRLLPMWCRPWSD